MGGFKPHLVSDIGLENMSQRITVLVLALGLLLAACQPAANPTANPEVSPSPRPSATSQPTATLPPTPTVTPAWWVADEDLDGVRLHFLHPWAGDLSHQIDILVDEFNQTNPWNVHVMVASTGSVAALFDEVSGGLEAGGSPRVVIAAPEQILTWAQKPGQVVDLGPFITDAQVGIDPTAVPTAFWQPAETGGWQLGLPILGSLRVMVYNRTWAQELGFREPPTTPAQFEQQACAAAQYNQTDDTRANDGTGGWYVDTEPDTLLSWLRAFGVSDLVGEDELAYDFSQEDSREAFLYLHELMAEGCIWMGRQPSPYDYFAGRNALFYSAALAELDAQAQAQARSESSDQWTVIPFPSVTGEGEWLVSAFSLAVLEGPPAENLAAWHFARWLAQPERLARLAAAGGLLPANQTAIDALVESGRMPPQWNAAVQGLEHGFTPPQRGSWRFARMVLEDAAWQSLQAGTAEQIPALLAELDATIREVGEQLGYVEE